MTIHWKAEIEKIAEPCDGYMWDVQMWSRAGKKAAYMYCGNGSMFRTLANATAYAEALAESIEWKIPDRYNPDKVWIIKRYADGHYMAAQEICGKMQSFYSARAKRYYTKFQRITKDRWKDIIKEA